MTKNIKFDLEKIIYIYLKEHLLRKQLIIHCLNS